MARPVPFRRLVAAVGTRVSIWDHDFIVRRVDIQAMRANTGFIYIGDDSVCAESGHENGNFLEAKGVITLEGVNLRELFIDSTVANEGVTGLAYT